MAFDSFGAGMSRGIARSQQERLNRQNLAGNQAQQQLENVLGAIERSDAATTEHLANLSEAATQLITSGQITDPNAQEIAELKRNAMSAAMSHALSLRQFSDAVLEGAPGLEGQLGAIDPIAYVENKLLEFDTRIAAAFGQTPAAEGRRAGQASLAEARQILGREPTDEERQQLSGATSRPLVQVGDKKETAFASAIGAADAEFLNVIREQGNAARSRLVEVDRIRAALDSGNFETGVFADSRVFLARLFEFLNVEPPGDIVGDAATADTLDAAANRLGIEMAKAMGRVTNLSLEFIRNSLPGLTRTVEGNRILAEVMRRTSERELEVARIAEEYRRAGSLTPEGLPPFFERIDELDREDPIIDDQLKRRIQEGSRGAPSTFRSFNNPFNPFIDRLPPGIPQGSTFLGTDEQGRRGYQTPEGKILVVQPSESG